MKDNLIRIDNDPASDYDNYLKYISTYDTNTITIKSEPSKTWLGRQCEICGKGTKDVNTHICDECRERLKKLLYVES